MTPEEVVTDALNRASPREVSPDWLPAWAWIPVEKWPAKALAVLPVYSVITVKPPWYGARYSSGQRWMTPVVHRGERYWLVGCYRGDGTVAWEIADYLGAVAPGEGGAP